MQMTTLIRRLGSNDARIIARDQFLISMLAYSFVIMAILRLATPPITNALLNGTGFDLSTLYPLIVSGLIVHQAAAVLSGCIAGFMLIDERDQNTLTALLVTPVPMPQYLGYRVLVPMAMSFVLGFFGVLVMGNITAEITWWQSALMALVNAPFAAAISLMMATFAENKVAGFAMIKIVGSLMLIILGAWFVAEPWQFLFGVYPPYWTMKAFWAIEVGSAWWPLYMVVSLVTHSIALWFLVRAFQRAAYDV